MPLVTKLLPLKEHIDAFPDSCLHLQQRWEQVREEKNLDNEYEDFEEYNDEDEYLDSHMEPSILNRPRPKKPVQAPSLPQRSEKRASKLLESVIQELKALDETAAKEEADRISVVRESDPHELYLSSEEDASLSDDYEGSLMDFEGSDEEEPRGRSSTPSRRKSQEVTARVVSFIVVGKPQIIDIFNTSPTNSVPTYRRHSMNLDTLTSLGSKFTSSSPSKPAPRRPAPLKLHPSIRRMSISSTTSYIPPTSNSPGAPIMQNPNASMTNLSTMSSHTCSSSQQHPARKSSRLGLSNLTSLVTNHSYSSYNNARKYYSASNPTPVTASSNQSFLQSDPFAHNYSHPSHQDAIHNLPPSPTETPVTPKTPTSMAAWKKGLSRTISKATRKQSIPKLNAIFQSHGQAHAHSQIQSQAQASIYTPSVASSSTRNHPRSSTSHSHISALTTTSSTSNTTPEQSTDTLARIMSTPEPETPKLLDTAHSMSAQMAVRRSETMPIAPSPRDSTFSGNGYGKKGLTYEEVLRQVAARGPPPVPVEERERRKEGRRSFGMIGMGMGMGRRKSVKK